MPLFPWCFFFFQAEDGIRDDLVTGVQTCALPICQDPNNLDVSASSHCLRQLLACYFEWVFAARRRKKVNFAADDVSVAHTLEDQSLQDVAFFACEDDVSVSKELQNKPQLTGLGFETKDNYSFKLMLINIEEPSIAQVLPKRHTETGRRK